MDDRYQFPRSFWLNRQPRAWSARTGNNAYPSTVGESMDRQTKREIWLLAIGTALVELPVAFAAFTILSH
jgi:hypothetical protein